MTDQLTRYDTVATKPVGGSSLRRFSSRLLDRAPRQERLARFYRRVLKPNVQAQTKPIPIITIEPELLQPDPEPRRLFGRLSFSVCVVVPALLAVLYFAFLATDQYVAEMRLVVRMGAQESGGGGLSSLLSGGSGSSGSSSSGGASSAMSMDGGGVSVSGTASGTSLENAHILTSYINSRGIVDDLVRTVDLQAIYTRPEADFYARLKQHPTRDELREYWTDMVSTFVDGNSGIVTVAVRAFRPDDALLILRAVETLSEKLLNDISDRARQDTIRRATDELARARAKMLSAIGDMERYRNAEGTVDPVQTATDTAKLATKVTGDLLRAENQLAVARSAMSPESPTIKFLLPQVETLRRQVEDLKSQIAGNGSGSHNIAATLARYEEVAIKQKMAETLYGLAIRGLEKARSAAEAQSVYLTVFVPPALPEDDTYPKRWQYSLLISAALLVVWGIGALVAASVDDHRLE